MSKRSSLEERMEGAIGGESDDGLPIIYNPDTGEVDGVEPSEENELVGGHAPAPALATVTPVEPPVVVPPKKKKKKKKRTVIKTVEHDAKGRVSRIIETEE